MKKPMAEELLSVNIMQRKNRRKRAEYREEDRK
jgi:hypothetical protein